MSEPKPISERVSVLETQVDYHSTRLEENQVISNKLIERLDNHMVASAERDAQLQDNLTQVTIAVTHLSTTVQETNTTLKAIAGVANDSRDKWRELDASMAAVLKVFAAIAIIVGGLWAAGTFLYDHHELLPHVESAHIESK